jgi:uncharacterized protein
MSTTPQPLAADLGLKADRVRRELAATGGAVVAFSGGVDSTLLLQLAREALGDRCVALVAVSPSLPVREREAARELASRLGVELVERETEELSRPGFAANGRDRCFFCKAELFDHAFAEAESRGFPAVVYGATADDVGDHRPGMRAARERGARAPLLEAGLGKEEIRALSRALDLPTWDKPAMACLSSRFPYGTPITRANLSRVERAEAAVRDEGFRDLRVRFHDDTARIEVGETEWSSWGDAARRSRVVRALRDLGFRYVVVDLEGFRSGRLNEDPQA